MYNLQINAAVRLQDMIAYCLIATHNVPSVTCNTLVKSCAAMLTCFAQVPKALWATAGGNSEKMSVDMIRHRLRTGI